MQTDKGRETDWVESCLLIPSKQLRACGEGIVAGRSGRLSGGLRRRGEPSAGRGLWWGWGGGEDGSVRLPSGPAHLSWAAVSPRRLRTDTAGSQGLPEVSPRRMERRWAGKLRGLWLGPPQPGLGRGASQPGLQSHVHLLACWGPCSIEVGPRDQGPSACWLCGLAQRLKWCLGLAGARASWAFGRSRLSA